PRRSARVSAGPSVTRPARARAAGCRPRTAPHGSSTEARSSWARRGRAAGGDSRASAGEASSSATERGRRSPAAGRRPEGRHGAASEGRIPEDVGAHGLVALGFLRLAAGAAHDARGALLRRAEWALAPARCLVVAAHLLLHP